MKQHPLIGPLGQALLLKNLCTQSPVCQPSVQSICSWPAAGLEKPAPLQAETQVAFLLGNHPQEGGLPSLPLSGSPTDSMAPSLGAGGEPPGKATFSSKPRAGARPSDTWKTAWRNVIRCTQASYLA